MLQHVMSLTLLAAVASASPATSQIRMNTSISGKPSAPAARLMVANPSLTSSIDTAAAIAVGDAMRERISRSLGTAYAVLSKRDMNSALAGYGFAENELLTASSAVRLAGYMDARLVVTSMMTKSADGRLTITARVANAGGTADVGHVAIVAQSAGQPLPDLGNKVADALVPAIKGWADAKTCLDLSTTKPDKANEAANKAFRVQPGHGLAGFCLAEMAKLKDSVGVATMKQWQEVIKADPLSLTAMSELAVIYQVQKDSSKVVETFQQMLRVAPSNQALRDQSYKLFASYGRPDAAMQVVEEGIKMDPANTDWYDLKSNVCLGREDYTCAIGALEELYAIDSTKADTLFYAKILGSTKTKPDTAKYLLWAKRGATKYDSRPDILEELAIAYSWTNENDLAVATAQKMIMLDDTRTDALMRIVKALIDDKHFAQAAAFAPTVKGFSDPEAKNTYGSVLFTGAQALAGVQPVDFPSLVLLSEAILSVGPSNANLITFSNYYMVLGLQSSLSEQSQALRSPAVTCEASRKYDALLTKLEPALRVIVASSNEQVAKYGSGLLSAVLGEKPVVAAQIVKLCK